MAQIIPEVSAKLNQLARQYARRLENAVTRTLEQKKFKATGSLSGSVKARVINTTNPKEAPEIVIEFAEHGDYIGKRKLIYTKMPPPDKILEWIQSGKFRMRNVPGYKEGAIPQISLLKQQQRVAFAIAASKKKEQKHRPKRWKREALPPELRHMNREIIEAYRAETEKIIAKSLTNG